MSIGARIREVRKQTGVSQTEFAEIVGISRSTLRAFELDEREPTSSLMLKLHESKGISPTWLLTGKGAKTAALHQDYLQHALTAIKAFCSIRRIDFSSEKQAQLSVLLAEYYSEGGQIGGPVETQILESAS